MLRGGKVILRAVEPEDLDLMYVVENDTSLWSLGAATVPYSRYALRRFIEESRGDIYRDGQLRLAVATPEGGTAGFIDLQSLDARHLRAEVGVVIVPGFQRRGLGLEALSLLRDYAWRHLRLHQLYAHVAEDNAPARAPFRAAGYKETARLAHWLRGAGGWRDAVVCQLLLPA